MCTEGYRSFMVHFKIEVVFATKTKAHLVLELGEGLWPLKGDTLL